MMYTVYWFDLSGVFTSGTFTTLETAMKVADYIRAAGLTLSGIKCGDVVIQG